MQQCPDALLAHPPKCCLQETITIAPVDGAKLWQPVLYGSAEWNARYHTLRNTIEGENGVAKRGSLADLDNPEGRRIRGTAAQSIFTALLLMATNIQQITAFLDTAEADKEGVLRKPQTRRRDTASLNDWAPTPLARGGAPPP
ncbi:MAG: hypothetical protein ACHQIG_07415 [Acidimicrobiia bacterium]